MYIEEIKFSETMVAKARCFLDDRAVSDTSTAMYQMVLPEESSPHGQLAPGLRHSIWLGNFNEIADFSQRIAGNETRPKNSETIVEVVDVSKKPRDENFGMEFSGYITVPKTGLYRFSLDSDDGSQLWIAGKLLIDNDGLHSAKRMEATIALERGEHLFEVSFFEKTGQEELKVEWAFPGEEFTEIPPKAFFH
jgi:hexosaminidase